MARFNTGKTTSKVKAPKSPIVTNTVSTTRTALGAPGFTRDTKSELFLLAVSNFVGVDLFHEKAAARDDRFEKLVHSVALADPQWLLDFVTWLRKDGNMRSASLVAGLEGAAALHGAGNTDGWARKLVSAPLQRADEVGEALGYWAAKYSAVKPGKPIHLPKPVKRGLGDAALRLYNEYSALKYDTASKGARFGDVLELTHPPAAASIPLFKFLLDSRRGRGVADDSLPMIQAQTAVRAQVALGNCDSLLNSESLRAAGMTWEDVLSLAGSKVPKRALWEAIIPSMGLFALVRNLRNFDEAGVGDEAYEKVAAKLKNAEQVRKSRMFPFRFLAAYRNTSNLRWHYPLEQALTHSLANVPSLPGRTLIMVDRSGSMFTTQGKSDMTLADQAAVFGVGLALRAEDATLVQFGSTSGTIPVSKGASMLPLIGAFGNLGGTDTPAALKRYYKGHDRVIIVTDEQYASYGYSRHTNGTWIDQMVPRDKPVYTWNLAGYQAAHGPGTPNRHWLGGLSDSSFGLISLLESGSDGSWPWDRGGAAE
jgi:hypothetical protein